MNEHPDVHPSKRTNAATNEPQKKKRKVNSEMQNLFINSNYQAGQFVCKDIRLTSDRNLSKKSSRTEYDNGNVNEQQSRMNNESNIRKPTNSIISAQSISSPVSNIMRMQQNNNNTCLATPCLATYSEKYSN